jgi:nitroreductase
MECIRCFHCYAVCPHQAIGIGGVKLDMLPDIHTMRPAGESQLMHLLAHRRSIRSFKDQKVDKSIVEKLIRAAGYIPSGGNSHSYRFTVITEGDIKDRLYSELEKIYLKMRRLLKHKLLRFLFTLFADPQTRAFLQDSTYLTRVSFLLDQIGQGEDPIFYNAPLVIVIHSQKLIPTPKEDSVLAAYNIVLLAQTMGLGSCLVSLAQNAINASRRCKKILNINQTDKVHAVVVIGYPAVQFRRAVPKRPKPINWCSTKKSDRNPIIGNGYGHRGNKIK